MVLIDGFEIEVRKLGWHLTLQDPIFLISNMKRLSTEDLQVRLASE